MPKYLFKIIRLMEVTSEEIVEVEAASSELAHEIVSGGDEEHFRTVREEEDVDGDELDYNVELVWDEEHPNARFDLPRCFDEDD
jgi:hypothetical protein